MFIFVPVMATKVVITDLQRGIEDTSKYGAAYEERRSELQERINSNGLLSVNRNVFKKTAEEKELLKKEKSKFKNK